MDPLRASSSRLKAKLGQYMRAVRAGKEIVITDRDQPVARLVPYREKRPGTRDGILASAVRDPVAPPLGQIEVAGIDYHGPDTTTLLREDRARR